MLQYLKQVVDRYARTQEGFEKRLGRAHKTMLYREQVRNQRITHVPLPRPALSAQLRQSLSRPDLETSEASSRNTPNAEAFSSSSKETNSGSSKGPKSEQTAGGREMHRKKKKGKKVTTDTLYAVMIFYEFVKELASISEEHSVLHSLLYLPNPTTLLSDL